MLHELITSNRLALIGRCRVKVSRRSSPPATEAELQHGIPLFLNHLIEALLDDQESRARQGDPGSGSGPRRHDSRKTDRDATLHGAELFKLGYTIEQVVHDYGDLCQAVTELAKDTNAPVTIDEFHTFNQLLDNAIANAVSAYGAAQRYAPERVAIHDRLGTLAEDQRILLDTALKALDALKAGNIGLMGATGTLLEDSLMKLRDLIDRSLPEIRVASGIVTSPGTTER